VRRPALETSADPLTGDVVLRGVVGVGDSAVVSIAYRDQNRAYLSALREALATRGITVGQTARATSDSSADTLFTVLSPPLREIMPALEKPSQNQIAEILFKTVGLERAGVGTADSGRRVIERQLREWGVPDDGVAVRDGSGLSRHDYVTPETIVKVLDVVRRGPNFQVFYDALPIAGVDGTIARRMKGTPAENNVHAKTGSVDKARSLSGYVRTADGRMLLFSFLCNNFSVPLRAVEQVQDAIAARLASLSIGASTAGR
jgi:D-alanyl-D-alanine carboxypeptidase/D-alanyl-D-alanine-endopeptidase (penicillin-binding protein 4)